MFYDMNKIPKGAVNFIFTYTDTDSVKSMPISNAVIRKKCIRKRIKILKKYAYNKKNWKEFYKKYVQNEYNKFRN